MEKINQITQMEEKSNLKSRKPPQLWNYHDSDKENQIHLSVDVYKDYKDKELFALINFIKEMSGLLWEFNGKKWERQLLLVIDSFDDEVTINED